MIVSFKDRADAGKKLAAKIRLIDMPNPVVIALPRGGVPVAYEVAKALRAPLLVLPVRKLGAPHNPELAIGAVADGAPPHVLLDPALIEALRVSKDYIEAETARQIERIRQQEVSFDVAATPASLAGRTAIVVDDGVATGATTRAALAAVRDRHPAALVLAVPVGDIGVLEKLRAEADNLVCVLATDYLSAVGAFYRDFTQVEDAVVVDLLRKSAAQHKALVG
jgi:putative phosphoribosyl transferase